MSANLKWKTPRNSNYDQHANLISKNSRDTDSYEIKILYAYNRTFMHYHSWKEGIFPRKSSNLDLSLVYLWTQG